jgi:hypothetical protein
MDVLSGPCDHVVLSHEQVSSLPSSLCLTDPQVISLNVLTHEDLRAPNLRQPDAADNNSRNLA